MLKREPRIWPSAPSFTVQAVKQSLRARQELFWIIQNGIRFTGMPAFGKVESPDHIWDLVNYVRTLPGELHGENSTESVGRKDPSVSVARHRLGRHVGCARSGSCA